MSSAADIIRPIVGLATNQFIPMSDTGFVFACLTLSIECATLLFWAVLLVAIVRDRHYEDANNLLVMSFAFAGVIGSSTLFHHAVTSVSGRGYSRGFIGCIWDSYFITVGFCASGLSVVIIALDRYLLMCHGYFTSWSKTGILLLICWFISLVVPALLIFPTLPDSIIFANEVICYPNFASKDPLINGMLLPGILIIIVAIGIMVFCYANVFYTYNSILLRKHKKLAKKDATLSDKSKKLLYKLCILTANFLITFVPLVVNFGIMMTTHRDIPNLAGQLIVLVFEIGLLLNPILIYSLDATMKVSVNEMFGVDLFRGRGMNTNIVAKNDKVDEIQLNGPRAPKPKESTLAAAQPVDTAPMLIDSVLSATEKIIRVQDM